MQPSIPEAKLTLSQLLYRLRQVYQPDSKALSSLDQAAIDRTDSKITSMYLMKSNELIPLLDTINKITFKITRTN